MFAAIFNVDGKPVDLRRFGTVGYDFESLEQAGHVAFICSKAGCPSATGETIGIQRLGGQYWIVGRVRLDACDELRSLLSSHSRVPLGEVSDAELCLHAYAAWGDAFLDRLAGDFCFTLWDGVRKRLICARDTSSAYGRFFMRRPGGRGSSAIHWTGSPHRPAFRATWTIPGSPIS